MADLLVERACIKHADLVLDKEGRGLRVALEFFAGVESINASLLFEDTCETLFFIRDFLKISKRGSWRDIMDKTPQIPVCICVKSRGPLVAIGDVHKDYWLVITRSNGWHTYKVYEGNDIVSALEEGLI